jgi:hypothetical protein
LDFHVKSCIQKEGSFHKEILLKFRGGGGEGLLNCYIGSIALHGAENWTLRKVGQTYLEILEMWWWRSLQEVSWTDRLRNERNYMESRRRGILCKQEKDRRLGRMLRRNCLLKQVTERKRDGRI